MTQILSTNTFTTAKWIVSPTLSNGTHTTIASAIAAASAGDTIFIRPGTYTENFTLPAGITITAFSGDQFNGIVKVKGKITCNDSGVRSISNLALENNGSYCIEVSGVADTQLQVDNCEFNLLNVGLNYTSSSANSYVNLSYCTGYVNAAPGALYTHSSAGQLYISYSVFTKLGAYTTQSTSTAGDTLFDFTRMNIPMSVTNASIGFNWCNCDVQNVTALTLNGTAGCQANTTFFDGGTQPACIINNTAILNLYNCSIRSTGATAISGAGSLVCTPIGFRDTKTISVGTLTLKPFGPPFYLYEDKGVTDTVDLEVDNTYFVTAATTQTLPASPEQGASVTIICEDAGPIVVTANTGQYIRIGNNLSSVGGTATNSDIGDSLTLIYRATNTTWVAQSSMGNWVLA